MSANQPARKSFLDILMKMARENRTGVLRSEGDTLPFEIHLDRGWVVNVTGEFEGEPSIEEIIAKSGFLERATFQKILKKSRKNNVPFVMYVVKKELFSDVFLRRILENVIWERLDRIMEQRSLSVSFDRIAPIPLKNLSAIHLPAYLRRYKAEQATRQTVAAAFPNELVVPAKTTKDTGPYEHDDRFDVKARIIYFFANGHRSFRDILYISGLGYVRTGDALNTLRSLGLVEYLERPRKGKVRQTMFQRVLYHGVLPVTFFLLMLASFYFSDTIRELEPYDQAAAYRIQTVPLFDEAIELFRLRELRAPNSLGELFETEILPRQWRRYRRDYEKAVREREERARRDN